MEEFHRLRAFSKDLEAVLDLTEKTKWLKQENEEFRKKIRKVENENIQLKHKYKHGVMINKLLELQGFKICPDCGGEGGFENGEGGELCPTCGGTGFVEKEIK